MKQVVTLVFTGALEPHGFVDFVAHRARRLDLDARVDEAGPSAVAVTVAGQPDLIDAFEEACSLGPSDSLVRHVARRPAAAAAGPAA